MCPSREQHQFNCRNFPQGSIIGPIIFNIFVNDIFYFTDKASLFNYADDNTLIYCHKDIDVVRHTLKKESLELIKWFRENKMQANPQKLQAIVIDKARISDDIVFNIGDVDIKCEQTVKLLGVHIDTCLNFDAHIRNLCIIKDIQTDKCSQ